MKEIHLMLYKLAMREIVEILDDSPNDADLICGVDGERVWQLSDELLQTCDCQNCDRHARLRFWLKSRREAEVELEKLGMDLAKVRGGWY